MSDEFLGRREDARLTTGRGRFIADRNIPGQAYGQFLRADRAHAEIRGIDTTAAEAMPGVIAVFTAQTADGLGVFQPSYPFKGQGGMAVASPPRPCLATGRVRYNGEPVALVVAETQAQALDAVEAIQVDYLDLPVMIDPASAMAQGAAQLHEGIPGNINFIQEYGDQAATDAAFAKARWTAAVTLHAQRLIGNPMEPKACVCSYDAASETYERNAPNQGLSMMMSRLAPMVGVSPDKIRIMPGDVGGAFGIRADAYAEYGACLYAAKALGRAVKWVGSRGESMVSDHHGRAADLMGELALDEEGRFTAIRIRWLVNSGAYASAAGVLINSVFSANQAVGVYRIPAAHGLHRLIYTNTTPTAAYRGAGRPNCTYLIERLVDQAAAVSGIDRIDLRRRNLIAKAQFPYATPVGSVYDSGDPEGLLDEALARSDWANFEARRREAAGRGKLRGIGCCVIISPSGGAAAQEEAVISFDDGETVRLYSLVGPSGQGHETVFPQLVADRLGLDPKDVELRFGDPDGPAVVGGGSGGSRSLISAGSVFIKASDAVIAKGAALIAAAAGTDVDKVSFEDGLYRIAGTNTSKSLRELARELAGTGSHPLTTLASISTSAAWPSGSHVAEVEIDPDTGEMEIVSYVGVDDCGTLINPTLVTGQLLGGFVQGLGQVIGEHCIYDEETGQLLTGSFMDYAMPKAADLPARLSFHHRPVPSPSNVLGAKGAGEAGTTGAIPALANAVLDALRPAGVQALDMPYTSHRIWSALQAAR